MSKNKPKAAFRSPLPARLTLIFLVLGLIVIFSYSAWQSYYAKVLSFKTVPPSDPQKAPIRYSKPIFLEIPKADIRLPISEAAIRGGIWESNMGSASHLKESALPGRGGNIILYGYNKPELFSRLTKLEVGDQISVIVADGKSYKYQVSQTLVVKPDEVGVLAPSQEEILTMYTSTGLFDSKRLVIRAKPLGRLQ